MNECVCGGGGGLRQIFSTFLCMQLMLIRCELSLCLLNRQDGSGNQCCYEQDGNLLYAADTYQGSTPDRSHDWGSVPYGAPYHVPSLSHWTHDVITFYYCCLWVSTVSVTTTWTAGPLATARPTRHLIQVNTTARPPCLHIKVKTMTARPTRLLIQVNTTARPTRLLIQVNTTARPTRLLISDKHVCKAYTPPHSGKHDCKVYTPPHSGKNYDCNAHTPSTFR